MLKIIIHAPTASALARARRNLANLIAADPNSLVELVINGEAIKAELANPDPATIRQTVMCKNSLDAAGLAAPQGIRIVPAAVLYISQRQAEGWVYFRA